MPPKAGFECISLGGDLFRRRSGIPGAGQGLFTYRRIRAKAIIGVYLGDIYPAGKVFEKGFNKDYCMEVGAYVESKNEDFQEGFIIDGITMENHMRWINDARRGYHALENNAESEQVGIEIHIRAKRAIKPYEEICMSYGPSYWSKTDDIYDY